jgi:squalene-hopene/tetraprenyl-beta-curcumene cyclase
MGFQWASPAPDRKRRLELASSQQLKDMRPALVAAIESSAEALTGMQHREGYWCAELTADSTLESDYVLLQLWLHPPVNGAWNPPSKARIGKACKFILERQLADGGWTTFPQGPSEVNATVRSYTALKLGGHDPAAPYMRRALERALALGGLQACNSYTKINFSLFDLFPRKYAPTVPPEIVLLPGDILYEMSSWTRAIVVPLSIVQAVSLHKPVPEGFNVEELYKPGKKLVMPSRGRTGILFSHFDKVIKLWDRRGLKNVRLAALREAEHWMLDRTRYADGLGAIYPSMMYLIMALDSLNYADDHPDRIEAIRQFENLIIETEDRFQFQPCYSPIWDTSYAAFALGEMGAADPGALRKSADWMLDREVRRKGDWTVKRPGLEPSGWAFEFANEHYPDIDDTAMVLLALLHAKASDPERQARVEKRAVNWLLGMQSSDGGWAAFDVDCNWDLLNKVPFADHNAMLDPTCPDITGRVLESLCRRGFTTEHSAVQRGVHYLLGCQESNGSWYGRWGVNYIYGTFLAVRGLDAANARDARPAMIRAADWIRSVQNADGGWGESCAGYAKNRFVGAESTPSQTAWALLALHACGDRGSEYMRRGVAYLIDTQKRDGTWDETLATGTGFPGVFYLSYHMYRQYFPLMALTVCRPSESPV